jgi:hypothetical protein
MRISSQSSPPPECPDVSKEPSATRVPFLSCNVINDLRAFGSAPWTSCRDGAGQVVLWSDTGAFELPPWFKPGFPWPCYRRAVTLCPKSKDDPPASTPSSRNIVSTMAVSALLIRACAERLRCPIGRSCSRFSYLWRVSRQIAIASERPESFPLDGSLPR